MILDNISFNEVLVNNLIKKNKAADAIPYIKSLLNMNPDNHNYHNLLIKASNNENLEQFFDDLLKDYPTSASIKLRRLQVINGEKFKAGLIEYVKPYFEKAQPSLFSEIKCLYANKEMIPLIENTLLEIEKQPTNPKNPCCDLWGFMLLAQHFDYLQQYEKALQYLEKVNYLQIN